RTADGDAGDAERAAAGVGDVEHARRRAGVERDGAEQDRRTGQADGRHGDGRRGGDATRGRDVHRGGAHAVRIDRVAEAKRLDVPERVDAVGTGTGQVIDREAAVTVVGDGVLVGRARELGDVGAGRDVVGQELANDHEVPGVDEAGEDRLLE